MSEATSTSFGTVSGVPEENLFRPSTATHPGDHGDSSTSATIYVAKAFPFSSGNPRIEETRGVMLLFFDDITPPSSALPVGRKPLLCVLGVPNHMTYADFCQYCGSFIQHILEMRIVRNDGIEDQYSILIRFDDQNSADAFHQHFNGRRFSSLEVDSCRVFFTVDVRYTSSIEHAQASPASSIEQPSCPVCLERLDQDTSGILTTICNHSFHCSCISKWTDSSCPTEDLHSYVVDGTCDFEIIQVCRYCQQQPEKSKCFICQTSENVWICVICGFVGCGRYKEGHAIQHWKETQHCYSLELETQRVWDYVGDNYVHRLIQSKTDGKLVELNRYCSHADGDCGSCECIVDSGFSEALLNSRVEAIVNEYNELLTSQLENQKIYFESLLQEAEEETEREKSVAIKNFLSQNVKMQRMQAKLDKGVEEKKFLDDINENLLRNKEIWEGIIVKIQEREKKAVRLKDEKIQELERQIKDMMAVLDGEGEDAVEEIPAASQEIKDGDVLALHASSKNSEGAVKSNSQRSS